MPLKTKSTRNKSRAFLLQIFDDSIDYSKFFIITYGIYHLYYKSSQVFCPITTTHNTQLLFQRITTQGQSLYNHFITHFSTIWNTFTYDFPYMGNIFYFINIFSLLWMITCILNHINLKFLHPKPLPSSPFGSLLEM